MLLAQLSSSVGSADSEDVNDLEDSHGIDNAQDDEPRKAVVPARPPEGDCLPHATPERAREENSQNWRVN